MTILQILIILFGIFAISRVFLRYKDKSIDISEFLIWTGIWLGVIIFVNLPFLLQGLSRALGVQRVSDLALYISVILLFYGIFRLNVKTERLNKEITKVVRKEAINKAKKK